MIGAINAGLEAAVAAVLAPFRAANPWLGLAFVSVLTGLLMLLAFKTMSDQAGLRRAKDRIKAHLLEIRLYRDDLRQSFRAQGRVLAANGRYLALAAKPLAVLLVPLVLFLAHLDIRFGERPLRPGESFLVKVKLAAGTSALASGLSLKAPPGLTIETEPLRIEEAGEIDWRVRADGPGLHRLSLEAAGLALDKEVAVGGPRLRRISPRRTRGPAAALLGPGEAPLPRGGRVASIEVAYPADRLSLFGIRVHWLIAYFVLSLLAGFALKRPLRTEF